MLPGRTCFKEKRPSTSLIVPFRVPLTNTEAPITGSPKLSTIDPKQVFSCWTMALESVVLACETAFSPAKRERNNRKPTDVSCFLLRFINRVCLFMYKQLIILYNLS